MAEEQKKNQAESKPNEEQKVEKAEKVENSEEVKSETKSSPFVTEEDTFEVEVKYYKENRKILVEDIDVDFDSSHDNESITFVFKYPDQGDCQYIAIGSNLNIGNEPDFQLRDIIQMEVSRLLVLIRKWSLEEELNNENVLKIHPKIVKAITSTIRNQIDMDGII